MSGKRLVAKRPLPEARVNRFSFLERVRPVPGQFHPINRLHIFDGSAREADWRERAIFCLPVRSRPGCRAPPLGGRFCPDGKNPGRWIIEASQP